MSRESSLPIFALITFQVVFYINSPISEAKDLTDVLQQGLTLSFPTAQVSTKDFALQAAPAFAGAISQAVTQEFPHASVAPAFAFQYNPTLSVFERTTSVPGPLFSERALPLGKGQLNFGVAYSYIDFSELNGTDLDNLSSSALLLDPTLKEAAPFLRAQGLLAAPIVLSTLRTKLDLQVHVAVPTLRYGITNDWDVSLAVPILNTALRVKTATIPVAVAAPANNAAYFYAKRTDGSLPDVGLRKLSCSTNCDRFGLAPVKLKDLTFIQSRNATRILSSARGSATGVGDIVLRSKYRLWDNGLGGAALGLNLQLPSGEQKDLQGTDETHLSTFLYLSQVFGERVEPHLNVGIDFNADDVDRSSFLYAVGASFLVWKQLGLTVDFIGRSEFNGFSVNASQPLLAGVQLDKGASGQCTTEQPCRVSADGTVKVFPETIKRNDIVDFSFGVRYGLGTSGSLFFGGIVPLNDDGFRADFIPSGGVEYTF